MRRMDSDGDGKLTVQEFKVALKRLHFKDEKQWSLKMIRRLFEDLDTDRDGLLSVEEFCFMINDNDNTQLSGEKNKENNPRKNEKYTGKSNLSDDEDDAIFSKQKNGSDIDLFRKINEVLSDIVPQNNNGNNNNSSNYGSTGEGNNHTTLVVKEVRRFF